MPNISLVESFSFSLMLLYTVRTRIIEPGAKTSKIPFLGYGGEHTEKADLLTLILEQNAKKKKSQTFFTSKEGSNILA